MRFFLGPPPKYSDPTFSKDVENWLLRLVDELKRVEANLDKTWFPTKDTDDLAEGVINKYYTTERAQDDIGGILLDTSSIDMAYDDTTPVISATVLPAGVDHALLANLNSVNYTHLTAANATDLTDGGESILHTHPGGSIDNVSGPATSVDGDVAVFDGITGKIIRDSGINEDDLFLLPGRAGGQIGYGGTGAGDDLTFIATTHGTPGTIYLTSQTYLNGVRTDPPGAYSAHTLFTSITTTVDYAAQGMGVDIFSALYPTVGTTYTRHRTLSATGYNYGAGTVAGLWGLIFAGGCLSTGNITTLKIIDATAYSAGSGAIGTIYGLHVANMSPSATYGVPTTAYGIGIDGNTTAVGTTKYGLYIGNQAGATTNYSIYTAGGACLINSGAAAQVPLAIRGHASQAGNLQEWQKSDGTAYLEVDADGDITLTKDGSSSSITQVVYADDKSNYLIAKRAGGTLASPTGLPDAGSPLVVEAWGHDGVSAFHKCGVASFTATELHSATVGGTQFKVQTMLTGGVSLANRLLIDGAGNVTINAIGTQSPTSMAAGFAIKSSTPPTAVGADIVALYTNDANGEAGKSWWHAMGEDDVEHQLLGLIFKDTTGNPATKHEGSLAFNSVDDTLKLFANDAWRQIPFDIMSYEDNIMFFDDDVLCW